MTDIIDLIDQVTAPTCGSCAKPLRADGPSLDFCGEVCAEAWRRQHGEPLDHASSAGGWNAGPITPPESSAYGLPQALVPHPSYTAPDAASLAAGVAYIASRCGRSEQPNFLPTTPLPGFRMELTDGRRWPVPDGSSPGVPSPTAVLIGGQHHGETMGVPNPPRHTLEIIEAVWPERILFDSDLHVEAQRVVYRLMCHNGAHWCYVDPRPAAPQRTVHVEGHEPLAIDYHHHDAQRDTWWVTITGRHRGVVWQLPGELLADGTALSVWFAERSRDGGVPSFWPNAADWRTAVDRVEDFRRLRDGSWDVTDQRPPWQQSAIRDALLAAITRIREALLPEPRTIELTREQWETMRSQEPSMRGLDRGPLPGDQVFGRQIVMVDRHEDSTIGQGQAARPYRDMRHCP